MNGLKTEFDGRAAVVRLNVADSDNAQMQQQLNMRGHPTFAVLDAQSQVTASFIGPQTTDVLRQALMQAISAGDP